MRTLTLATAIAAILTVPAHAGATMPRDFDGEWCFAVQQDNSKNYTLPSWTGDNPCVKILSIDAAGFEQLGLHKQPQIRPAGG